MLELFHSSPLLATITVGGFNPLAAIFGLVTFFQVTQFIYYGLDANDPSKDWSIPNRNLRILSFSIKKASETFEAFLIGILNKNLTFFRISSFLIGSWKLASETKG